MNPQMFIRVFKAFFEEKADGVIKVFEKMGVLTKGLLRLTSLYVKDKDNFLVVKLTFKFVFVDSMTIRVYPGMAQDMELVQKSSSCFCRSPRDLFWIYSTPNTSNLYPTCTIFWCLIDKHL